MFIRVNSEVDGRMSCAMLRCAHGVSDWTGRPARPSYDSESCWHHRAFDRGILMTSMQASQGLQPTAAGVGSNTTSR
jgi:hypothetical protein